MPSRSLYLRPPVHVVVCTHTTRHLGACLAALAVQTRPPASIIVSADTDDPAIGQLLRTLWPRLASACPHAPPPLVHVFRPHQHQARLNQVRNNGLRALEALFAPGEHDLVVMLDGDTLLDHHAIDRHATLAGAGADVVVPYRINLDGPTTDSLSPEQIADGRLAGGLTSLAKPDDRKGLHRRDRRYRLQLALRSLIPAGARFVKDHKPKVLGGHHAVTLRALRSVNGYDEQYVDYGYDDDDLSRRLFALRPRPRIAVAVKSILAFHLWHASRAPARPMLAPGFARFSQPDLPVFAERGLLNPLEQPEPTALFVSAAPAAAESTPRGRRVHHSRVHPAPRADAAPA